MNTSDSQPPEENESAPDNKRNIEHCYCDIGNGVKDKSKALCDLIETSFPRRCLVYGATLSDLTLIEALLKRRGISAVAMAKDLGPNERYMIADAFHSGKFNVALALDGNSRELSTWKPTVVFNYQIPDRPDCYLYRQPTAAVALQVISLVGPRDFQPFRTITKSLSISPVRLALPDAEQIAAVRAKRLSELFARDAGDPDTTDVLATRTALSELGVAVDQHSERILAQLLGACLRKSAEAASAGIIREFFDQNPPLAPQADEGGRGYRDDRGGRGDGRRDREDDRRGRGREQRGRGDDRQSRGRDRDRDRGRDNRRDGRRDSRDNREYRDNRDNRGRDNRQHQQNRQDNPRGNNREQQRPHDSADSEVMRIYIGQGFAQGMTPEVFTGLALEFAELRDPDILDLTIREHYGFVDVPAPVATQLIQNLNGIEYNGSLLVLEVATQMRR